MGPSLSDANRKALGDYLRTLADRLSLRDWTVTTMHASPQDHGHDRGFLAMVDSDPGSWEAKFYFRSDFAEHTPDQVRETCCHELLHVHRLAMRHLSEATIKDELNVGAWNVWLEAARLIDEMATEAIAQAIAPLMPEFPGWPEPAAA